MRKEELFEVLGDINADDVKKAGKYRARHKPAWMKWTAAAACAAILIGVLLGIPALKRENRIEKNETVASGLRTVAAAYPEPVAGNLSAQSFVNSEEHWKWWEDYSAKAEATRGLQKGMDGFYSAIMKELLVSKDENTVCSPVNLYLASAMLAEVSGGNTRRQILDMLEVPDIETLRSSATALWESNYADTPVIKSLLANSIWLNDSVRYNDETLNRLAQQYYASSFSGMPGSPEMDEALQSWTDANTGGVLKEYTKQMSIAPDTVLEILSTIYYKAQWAETFRTDSTTREIFHGVSGDMTVDMMHRSEILDTYRTETFTSVGLDLLDSGTMYFFLPNEGVDINSLACDPSVLAATRFSEEENWSSPMVHLSVPKFKAGGHTDLEETYRNLGLTDALDPALADFTPLTTEQDDLFLSKAEHAALVEIDENGVTGAAYTELAMSMGAAFTEDEMDFVLDRPFLFIVTGRDDSILFSGIVRNID